MIAYRAGYKYQLVRDYQIQTAILPQKEASTRFADINPDGLLCIQAGYAWDGPSGPVPDIPATMRGSLVHDALYELMRVGGLDRGFKDAADHLLCRLCIEDGLPHFCAQVIYEGVEWFGRRFTESYSEAPIIEVGQ